MTDTPDWTTDTRNKKQCLKPAQCFSHVRPARDGTRSPPPALYWPQRPNPIPGLGLPFLRLPEGLSLAHPSFLVAHQWWSW